MHIFYHPEFGYLLTLSSIILLFVQQSECQFTFARSCNDPDVAMHTQTFGHTYCSHACRGVTGIMDACGANGDCTCTPPCSDDPAVLIMPAQLPTSDICPPLASDPADPDANALPSCISRCAASCGGMGIICGEVGRVGAGMMTIAKVCTCACPAMPCTTTTTTTLAPTTTTQPVQVAIIKKPLIFILKIKKLVLLLLKKLPLICVILIKLFTLYLIKCLVISVYLYLAKQLILWQLSQFSGLLWWIIERFQTFSS